MILDVAHFIYVLQAIVHPNYDSNQYNDDIALIMLSKPAKIVGKGFLNIIVKELNFCLKDFAMGVTTACLPIDEKNVSRSLKVNNLR